jgi:hypothetical protein
MGSKLIPQSRKDFNVFLILSIQVYTSLKKTKQGKH